MSHALLNSRDDALGLAANIHSWRGADIPRYNATNWSSCTEAAPTFDGKHKHKTDARWEVPLPHDWETTKEKTKRDKEIGDLEEVGELPEGWRPEQEGL